MTHAAVGIRCPECAGRRTVMQRAGFTMARTPVLTYALIAANIALFVLTNRIGSGGGGLNFGSADLNSLGDRLVLFGPSVGKGQDYRLLTAAFIHYGLLHIAFNMYALYILGTFLEPSLGSARFTALYLASLFAGSLGVIVISPESHAVGASGAVFGLFAAAFVIARGRRLEAIATQLGVLLLINFVITLAVPRIAVGAHLFGAAAGALCGLLILAGDRGAFGRSRVAAELAVMAVLGVASFAFGVALA